MRSITYALMLALSTSIIISCQKDIDARIDEPEDKCKIVTSYYYGGSGMLNDSANYFYTTDGKLSKVEGEFEYVQYTYTGDKITLRRYFDRATNELIRIPFITKAITLKPCEVSTIGATSEQIPFTPMSCFLIRTIA